jgi:hypothetical protein
MPHKSLLIEILAAEYRSLLTFQRKLFSQGVTISATTDRLAAVACLIQWAEDEEL